jgi:predicted O-methyltransferase YrrM
MNIRFWVRHPWLIFSRIRYWLWEKRNSDKPWLCPGTVRFCETRLNKSMTALEFGSGRSTPWFAARVGHLISVEHNSAWHQQIRQQIETAAITNVDYRLVPLNHPEAEGEHPKYDPEPDYVAAIDQFPDASLDFVVVDGHYRTHCIRHALPKIKPGGYLLVDDINLWPSVDVFQIPKQWRIADDSTNGLKRCIIWQSS